MSILPVNWGMRLMGWAVRAVAWNPFDKPKLPPELPGPAKAEPAEEPEPPKGLLFNRDGSVFLEGGGPRIDEIDLGEDPSSIMMVLLEKQTRFKPMLDSQRIFLDNDQVLISVDALRRVFPALLRNDFLHGVSTARYDQLESWLKQLEEVRLP